MFQSLLGYSALRALIIIKKSFIQMGSDVYSSNLNIERGITQKKKVSKQFLESSHQFMYTKFSLI